jgi:hypothetical protein
VPDLIPHVATFRVILNTQDEVEAILAADKLKSVCEDYLDAEEGDQVVVTQVTSTSTDVEPSETLMILRRARNALIRTRIKECYDQAREMDRIAYSLEHRGEPEYALAGYDYSHLLEVAEAILKHGKDPL